MLSPGPRPHPLFGHPIAAGLNLPPFKGTIDVTKRLNCLSIHPIIIFKPSPEDASTWQRVPFPYQGDLLHFLTDDDGPYCINWTVKKDPTGFTQLHFGRPPSPNKAATDMEKAIIRHKVEEIYYQDACIRTIQVTLNAIPKHLAANLQHIFSWKNRELKISENQRRELVDWYLAEIPKDTPPMHQIPQMIKTFRCTREDCLISLYKGIWNREIRVDLFRPVLSDHALRPEMKDVLVEYSHWFAR